MLLIGKVTFQLGFSPKGHFSEKENIYMCEKRNGFYSERPFLQNLCKKLSERVFLR